METKTKPILTVTEYYALMDILRAVRNIAYAEPELCQKPLSYDDGSILNGSSGLGFIEELEETITLPDADKLYEIVSDIEDKLKECSEFTTKEQLEHLVSFEHMPDGWENDYKTTTQEKEGHVMGSHYEPRRKEFRDYLSSLSETNPKD